MDHRRKRGSIIFKGWEIPLKGGMRKAVHGRSNLMGREIKQLETLG